MAKRQVMKLLDIRSIPEIVRDETQVLEVSVESVLTLCSQKTQFRVSLSKEAAFPNIGDVEDTMIRLLGALHRFLWNLHPNWVRKSARP